MHASIAICALIGAVALLASTAHASHERQLIPPMVPTKRLAERRHAQNFGPTSPINIIGSTHDQLSKQPLSNSAPTVMRGLPNKKSDTNGAKMTESQPTEIPRKRIVANPANTAPYTVQSLDDILDKTVTTHDPNPVSTILGNDRVLGSADGKTAVLKASTKALTYDPPKRNRARPREEFRSNPTNLPKLDLRPPPQSQSTSYVDENGEVREYVTPHTLTNLDQSSKSGNSDHLYNGLLDEVNSKYSKYRDILSSADEK